MNFNIKSWLIIITIVSLIFSLSSSVYSMETEEKEEHARGPHGGRIFIDGDFSFELTIFESGIPPEFRVYLSDSQGKIAPKNVEVKIVLKRLGDVEDHINFIPQDDYLRGDMTIYEPHSFEVNITALYQGKQHQWHYDNFEGRVSISPEMAESMGIKTEIAGKAILKETVKAYGQVISPPGANLPVSARFEGVVKKVYVRLGEQVKAGQKLLTIESNESLTNYSIYAPINAVVADLNTAKGINVKNETLLTLINKRQSVVELDIFSKDRNSIKTGNKVKVSVNGYEKPFTGSVTLIGSKMKANQSVAVQVKLDDIKEEILPGSFASAHIQVGNYEVELAVKRDALQAFRDFTVVYAKVNDTYEVRMLELGREASPWVEVLGGLPHGTEYVTENSFIIKADIEKSGASHDH